MTSIVCAKASVAMFCCLWIPLTITLEDITYTCTLCRSRLAIEVKLWLRGTWMMCVAAVE